MLSGKSQSQKAIYYLITKCPKQENPQRQKVDDQWSQVEGGGEGILAPRIFSGVMRVFQS
jgi:hypothetical protein